MYTSSVDSVWLDAENDTNTDGSGSATAAVAKETTSQNGDRPKTSNKKKYTLPAGRSTLVSGFVTHCHTYSHECKHYCRP